MFRKGQKAQQDSEPGAEEIECKVQQDGSIEGTKFVGYITQHKPEKKGIETLNQIEVADAKKQCLYGVGNEKGTKCFLRIT